MSSSLSVCKAVIVGDSKTPQQLQVEEVCGLPQSQKQPHKLSSSRGNSLAAVDDNVFWHDPLLQHAHFGVVTTATEKPWRLGFEVAYLLPVPIKDAVPILLLDLIRLLLQFLKRAPCHHHPTG